MATLDLEQISKAYYENVTGEEYRGQINFNGLRLETVPGQTSWHVGPNQNSEAERYQVSVDMVQPGGASAYVKNNNTGSVTAECTLDRAYIKGINTLVKVPLSDDLNIFGSHVDINIGKQRYSATSTVPYHVTATGQVGAGVSSGGADIALRNIEGSGTFTSLVSLGGKIIFPVDNGSMETGVVEVLESVRVGSPFLRVGRQIQFTVRGSCRFSVKNHETIEYKR